MLRKKRTISVFLLLGLSGCTTQPSIPPWPEVPQEMLIKGDFADSTLLSYYEQGKDQLAAAEFGKWVYGRVKGKMVALAGLVRRRKAEASLYLNGTFTL